MGALNLSRTKKIDLNERQAVKRFANLIRFLRGELSLNELKFKINKPLPLNLIKMCDEFSGYMPKLTQEKLGLYLGCTYAAVQSWEKGDADRPAFPRLATFVKIAKLCNLTVNDLTDLLFDISDEPVAKEISYQSFEELLDCAVRERV